MKSSSITQLAMAALLASGVVLSVPAFAQTADTTVPGHPRVNEIDQRLQNQQTQIQNGVASGKLNATQAAKDEARDAKVSKQLSADEAKHNGHITKAEQKKMNKELNKNSKKIHKQEKKAGAAATATTPATTTTGQ
jgi:hypothetical protein